eukprot:snap_masked-scaffold_3-processed-gene-10.47-mRNA-1 protein AED:1.00 eAED:1.00 QI:0/-1/0/0/-1/1/1/0/118
MRAISETSVLSIEGKCLTRHQSKVVKVKYNHNADIFEKDLNKGAKAPKYEKKIGRFLGDEYWPVIGFIVLCHVGPIIHMKSRFKRQDLNEPIKLLNVLPVFNILNEYWDMEILICLSL